MLIIGCGYLGRRVAAFYRTVEPVVGVVRSESSVAELVREGLDSIKADLEDKLLPKLSLRDAQVFYFVPPNSSGHRDQRLRNFLEACGRWGHPRRIVYISTTGVYGDCNGNWIDENQPVRPQADRAKRRLDAEECLRRWSVEQEGDVVILRVAGIYGPGKLPLARIRKRLLLVRREEAPLTNRIHIEDLLQLCIAAMERGRAGEIYHASDGHPGTMVDYFNRIADLAGLTHPPVISMDDAAQKLSPGMLSYMRESRRVSNRKMREELGITLRYPDLEAGLPACFERPVKSK